MTYTNKTPRELAPMLHDLADRLEGLDLDQELSLAVSFQTGLGRKVADRDEAMVRIVDTLGMALVGNPGELQEMSSGTTHYKADGCTEAGLHVDIFDAFLDSPTTRKLREERDALQAQLDELKAKGSFDADRADRLENGAYDR